jgi:hypothetical protein
VSSRTAPPTGWPAPTGAQLAGAPVELTPLASEVADRYFARHPEDLDRYGADVARAWELHDTLHLLNWAIGDVEGFVALDEQVGWLADVLAARDFPLDHLADNLEIAADVAEQRVAAPVAERLRAAAALVRAR